MAVHFLLLLFAVSLVVADDGEWTRLPSPSLLTMLLRDPVFSSF